MTVALPRPRRLAALLVTAALAFATPAHADPPTAQASVGWGGVRIATTDGQIALSFHMLMQARSTATFDVGATPYADLRLFRARPMWVASFLHGRVTSTLQLEMVGGPRVLDARVDVQVGDRLELAVGQTIVPFNRSWLMPLPRLQTTERALTTDLFTPGRRDGGHLTAGTPDKRLRAWLGAYDATVPGERHDGLHAPMGFLRVEADPLGVMGPTELPSLSGESPLRVQVGVGGLVQPVWDPDDPDARDRLRATGTVDAGLTARGFSLYAESFLDHTAGSPLGWGATGQVGQFVVPRHLDVVARYTVIDQDADDGVGPRHWVEGKIGAYLHETNFLLDLRYRAGLGAGEDADHLVTLQGQAML